MRAISELVVAASVVILLVVVTTPAAGQQATSQRMELSGGQGVFNLAELGAVIIENDSVLTIAHAMPAANRPVAYREIDVRSGDTLLMVNGKRVRTAATLQGLYDTLAIGEALKLGLRRGKDLILATFAKADPASLPQMKMQMVTREGGEDPVGAPAGKKMMMIDNSDPSVVPLAQLGLVLRQGKGGLMVDKVLPNAAEVFGGAAPQPGAIITALNGKPVGTGAKFKEAFGKLKEGDRMTLDYRTEDDERSVALAVPPKGGMQMWQKGKE